MTEMRILVVDDDPVTCLFLKKIIEEIQGVAMVVTAGSGAEGLQTAEEYATHAVFLDIDMPGMNGLELARALLERQSGILPVFVTGYPDYALDSFEFYPVDYILKPIDEERVKTTVVKLKERIDAGRDNEPENPIMIEQQGRKVLLKPSEILYVESIKPRVHIRTRRDDYIFRRSLRALCKELIKYGFFQSHRSYLVNLQHVRQILPSGQTYEILLDSDEKVMLSRLQEPKLRRLLKS